MRRQVDAMRLRESRYGLRRLSLWRAVEGSSLGDLWNRVRSTVWPRVKWLIRPSIEATSSAQQTVVPARQASEVSWFVGFLLPQGGLSSLFLGGSPMAIA